MKLLNMNKPIFKRYIITIIIFFLLWLIISSYCIPLITSLSLETSNTIWYDIYYVITYFMFGFSFGIIGKKNGWILCILFVFSVIAFYAFIYKFTDVLQMDFYNVDFDTYIFKILYFHIFYLLYLFSGYLIFVLPYYFYRKKKH